MSAVKSTLELIERVLDRPLRAAVTCSFQAGGVALVHMLRRYEPDIPVLFVDTGYHFPETLAFRDRLASEWSLNLFVLSPEATVASHEANHGLLYRSDPDRCCAVRKVEPVQRALDGFEVWFTGLRRDQAPTRAHIRKVERKLLPSGRVIEKANPLADWSWHDVLSYHDHHSIPLHPLHLEGYPSIGCAPCTMPARIHDPRSGRWNGQKTECGLHTGEGEG
jgi:phosphoadenosine phosphosulfate reductase